MTILAFTTVLALASFVAGLVGALTGLGGGVVIVPLLVIAFRVDIHYAIGASLVSVIATSSGAAAAYVREGYSNIRLGMLLEIATTIGALSGAFICCTPHTCRGHTVRRWTCRPVPVASRLPCGSTVLIRQQWESRPTTCIGWEPASV